MQRASHPNSGQNIVAWPVPPAPEVPPVRLRVAAVFSTVGIIGLVLCSIWPVLGLWAIVPGAVFFIGSLLLLTPFLRFWDADLRRDMRKLYGRR
jgi:hypothetical protein